jgi:hypothetical protein
MSEMNDVKLAIAVTGGREFADVESVEARFAQVLQRTGFAPEDVMVFDGMARGADEICHRVAKQYGFLTERFPADWRSEPVKAGFIRNEQMADCLVALDCMVGVIACPGARGTAHMTRYSLSVGLLVSDLNGRQMLSPVPA